MLAGSDHLRRAAEMLAGWSGDRDVLLKAAQHFWSAAFDAPEWPEHLRSAYDRILPLMLGHGTVANTVPALSADDAQRLADEIAAFCVQALADNDAA